MQFTYSCAPRVSTNAPTFSEPCNFPPPARTVGKSKVMRCSRYGNGERMNVTLNGKSLEEVDCFK